MFSIARTILAGVLGMAGALGCAGFAAAQQGRLICSGTEPFWSVIHTGQAMWFSSPEVERLALALARARTAAGTTPDRVRVYQTRKLLDNSPVTLVVTRNDQSCTDGMSDRRFPYDAVYVDNDRVLHGCCRWEQ